MSGSFRATVRLTTLTALGAAVLSAAAGAAGDTLAPDELYRRVAGSIYMVIAARSAEDLKAKTNILQGSAVALTPELAVTNCHVIKDYGSIFLYFDKQASAATVERVDERSDICLLRAAKFKLNPAPKVRLSTELSVGERAYAIGAPRGLERSLSEGLVSGLRDHKGVRIVQTTAPISQGSSGGGLFDAQGRLIGITTRMIKQEGFLNFAVATDEFWPLAKTPAAAAAPQRTPQPAPQPAPQVAALPLGLRDGMVHRCGPIEVRSLEFAEKSVKCNERTSDVGDPQAGATTASFAGANGRAVLVVNSTRLIGNAHWKALSADDLRREARKFAAGSKSEAANLSDLQSAPFRHHTFNVQLNSRPHACAYGNFAASAEKQSIWITYCEAGTHRVSEDNLATVFRMISIK